MSFFTNKSSRTQFLSSLRNHVKESSNKFTRQNDERIWKPELDKTGTGSATFRFLPNSEADPHPYVVLYNHGFKSLSGKYYIENCPTTLRQECPACKANSELWATGTEANRKLVSERKRKQSFISNIYMINDPKHPENNGKVFLYKYGKKIFEKIKDALEPPPEFEMEPMNAFCPFEGANFRLRVTKVDGFPNFDKSTFDAPSALLGGDEKKLTAVESQLHSLSDMISTKQFKSYDELEKNLTRVLGVASATRTAVPVSAGVTDEDDEVEAAPVSKTRPAATPKAAPKAQTEEDEDDLDADYFANLARD